jgi:hypothetical protein
MAGTTVGTAAGSAGMVVAGNIAFCFYLEHLQPQSALRSDATLRFSSASLGRHPETRMAFNHYRCCRRGNGVGGWEALVVCGRVDRPSACRWALAGCVIAASASGDAHPPDQMLRG